MANVLFNGSLLGTVTNHEKLIEDVRKKRRSSGYTHKLNVSYDETNDEVAINTDAGRIRRPLIVVENGKSKLTKTMVDEISAGKKNWDDLIKKGIIEHLDPDEEENAYVAIREDQLTKDHTHLELNPLAILGISSSIIPYGEYDRGDRVNYGAKMIGQTIGMYATNFPVRADTKSNLFVYSQNPITSSLTYPILGLSDHPSGQNVVIALMSHEGYNIEDAIIINKGSIDRGFGRSFFFRTYQTEEKRYGGGQIDEIRIPDPDVRGYVSDKAYSNLGEDGTIFPEIPVESGDVLVGKVSPLKFTSKDELIASIHNRREASLGVMHGESGVVDKVMLTETKDGNRFVKVTVREQRVPEIGDKFASRHGQKGVVGLIVPEQDMPFTSQGITPDIIMNPHSIPSRLTAGQLLEMISGKVGALEGRVVDGTMFNGEKEEPIRKALEDLGFRNDGKEVLYNGKTGERMEVEIFVGMIYYKRLEHMVKNKIHARARGPVALLTKQPTEGRANDGGLRFGEMEKDCLIAHGSSLLLKERFSSDNAIIPVCTKCGMVAQQDFNKNKIACATCKRSKVEYVEMSYAFKLMLDELKSLMIYPQMIIGEK